MLCLLTLPVRVTPGYPESTERPWYCHRTSACHEDTRCLDPQSQNREGTSPAVSAPHYLQARGSANPTVRPVPPSRQGGGAGQGAVGTQPRGTCAAATDPKAVARGWCVCPCGKHTAHGGKKGPRGGPGMYSFWGDPTLCPQRQWKPRAPQTRCIFRLSSHCPGNQSPSTWETEAGPQTPSPCSEGQKCKSQHLRLRQRGFHNVTA